MVHLCPENKFQNYYGKDCLSDAEKPIACSSASSHEDKLMTFCVLLLLNNGQLFSAWNPPDVDFLWLLFPRQSKSENVCNHK